eukprot:8544727-Pyramimonas_sp.AAC.1
MTWPLLMREIDISERAECLSYALVELVLLPVVVASSMKNYQADTISACGAVLDCVKDNQEKDIFPLPHPR